MVHGHPMPWEYKQNACVNPWWKWIDERPPIQTPTQCWRLGCELQPAWAQLSQISRQPWGSSSKQVRHWGWSLHVGLVLSQMDAVVLAVYVSLSISWLLRCSGCDLWPTFRPTCAHLWEVLHVSRLICSTARWLGGFGFGGWGGVITSFPRRSHRSSLSCNIQHTLDATSWNLFLQHPTRSWCYVMELVLDAIYLGSASCLSADLFDGTLVGGVWVWGVGGCDNVLSTTFSSFFVILQHPTHSWCYVMELVLATSNTLLVLRDGTCSWCYLFGKWFMSLGWSVRRHVGWGGSGFGGGVGGWCDNVLSTTFLTFFVILQHPTRSWCYVMELVLATSNTNRVSWSSTRLQRPFHASPATKIWALYVLCSSFPLNGMSICCRLFKSVDEMSINGKCKAHILL